MRKHMALWMLLALVSSAVSSASAEVPLVVSPEAAPGGNGSQQKPFQTLVQARDAIRTHRQAGTLKKEEAVTVSLEPGGYPLAASLEINAADSGTAEAPVVYRARQGGKARLQGGVSLKASSFQAVTEATVLARLDQAVRDKVLCVRPLGRCPGRISKLQDLLPWSARGAWLYVNHQPMTLARWPNATAADGGWASFSKTVDNRPAQSQGGRSGHAESPSGSFIFDDPRPAGWNLADGVWLLGYWTHDWSDEVIRIASYDQEKKVIALAAPHNYGINGGTWGAAKRRFFAMNALEELDAPGEWYLDRSRKLLYFYPEGDLADAEIVLATLTEPLVKLNGAKHVQFVELAFEYGHGDGIVAQNAEHLEIAGCVVANLAGGGISLSGSANVVRSCDLFNLGKGGIYLNGGDRQTLTPAKNLAENNHIHHYGIFQRTYAPGIGANGCGQIARNNCIHDAPHNAVLYGGNEHLFELNEIYRVVMETGDAGAFYTGRDWTSQGNVLRHNYIHDLGGGDAGHVNTMGIYLDDCDSGDSLVGNVFYRAGRALMIGGGRDNAVLNNLVVDCPIGLHLDSRGMTWKQWNNPSDKSWCLLEKAERLNSQPPWSTKYPRLAAIMNEEPRQPLGNSIQRNVFVNCTKQVCSFDGNVKKLLDKLDIAENLVVNPSGTPEQMTQLAKTIPVKGFAVVFGAQAKRLDVNPAAQNAEETLSRWQPRLQKAIPAFEPIPFDKIGLQQDEYRRTLPAR